MNTSSLFIYNADKTSRIAKAVVGGVLVGGLAVVSAPPALSAAGFSAGGIVAGSFIAAKLMSAAAIANGGGVAAASAGGWIAAAQSAGAGGIGFFSNLLLSVGVGTAWTLVLSKKSKLKKGLRVNFGADTCSTGKSEISKFCYFFCFCYNVPFFFYIMIAQDFLYKRRISFK